MADEDQTPPQGGKGMLDIIPFLDAGVIRGLLLAVAGVIGTVMSFFGFNQDVFMTGAGKLVAAITVLITAAGVAWAMWARVKRPNPPLSQTAVVKRVELVEKGDLKVINDPSESVAAVKAAAKADIPTPPSSGGSNVG